MPHDAGLAMKLRLRADLLAAMKEGRAAEAKVLRTLVAAIDNAEAPPIIAGQGHQGETERLCLDDASVLAAIRAEAEEREHAAVQMDGLGKPIHAEALRTEAAIARRYLG